MGLGGRDRASGNRGPFFMSGNSVDDSLAPHIHTYFAATVPQRHQHAGEAGLLVPLVGSSIANALVFMADARRGTSTLARPACWCP